MFDCLIDWLSEVNWGLTRLDSRCYNTNLSLLSMNGKNQTTFSIDKVELKWLWKLEVIVGGLSWFYYQVADIDVLQYKFLHIEYN